MTNNIFLILNKKYPVYNSKNISILFRFKENLKKILIIVSFYSQIFVLHWHQMTEIKNQRINFVLCHLKDQ